MPVHHKAVMKCSANISHPSILSHLSFLLSEQQKLHRSGLVKQLVAMQFLLCQGLALRGHHDKDGNPYQLLVTWSKDSEIVANWLKQGRLMSHEHINEIIFLMGQAVLRKILIRTKSADPSWFSIIADEATDEACHAQLNLSVWYVDDEYL